MSKFACKCGVSVDLVRSPAREEYLLVPEINVEKAQAKLDGELSDDRDLFDIIDQGSREVIECPNCGRVWIQDRMDPKTYHAYAREES